MGSDNDFDKWITMMTLNENMNNYDTVRLGLFK